MAHTQKREHNSSCAYKMIMEANISWTLKRTRLEQAEHFFLDVLFTKKAEWQRGRNRGKASSIHWFSPQWLQRQGPSLTQVKILKLSLISFGSGEGARGTGHSNYLLLSPRCISKELEKKQAAVYEPVLHCGMPVSHTAAYPAEPQCWPEAEHFIWLTSFSLIANTQWKHFD